MNNYSPSITSVDIITMLMTSSKNTCVNVFLVRTRLKRYIKSLTGESIKLYLWISNLKICNSPFKFTWKLKCTLGKLKYWPVIISVSLKCCPDCASIVKLNSKHKRMQRIESCKEAVKVAKKLYWNHTSACFWN